MPSPSPTAATPWRPFIAESVAGLLTGADVRWWLSGGVALDRWLGHGIRPRRNIDVSVVARDLAALVGSLPDGFSAWIETEDDALVALTAADADADVQAVRILDDTAEAWVLQVNVEDGAPRAWVYKRDPRLTLPWASAVLDVDGVPTGAPEVQLVWKALRPRPEDDIDKDAVLPRLDERARSWYERAILSIHPHSSWSIHVRSPHAPAKASWNRRKS
ncbi:nucleotidyltransferase domain-containing protein [Microbacterium soli]|uniref:Amino acid transporter n=1 Tax=Microbacterium soli TaxID=446075 RepID=A0ABP7NAL1_9MICO